MYTVIRFTISVVGTEADYKSVKLRNRYELLGGVGGCDYYRRNWSKLVVYPPWMHL